MALVLDFGVGEATGRDLLIVAGDGEETGPNVVFVAHPVRAEEAIKASNETGKSFWVGSWIFIGSIIRQ